MRNISYRIQVLWSLLWLLFWLLSACTPITHSEPQLQPEEKFLNQDAKILSYYEEIRMMSAEDLELELARARGCLTPTTFPRDQLRLAMLLGMPEFRFNHDPEAEKLLKDYLLTEKTSALEEVQIARLLTDEIQWRKKIQQEIQILKQELQKERIKSSKLMGKLTKAQSKLNQLRNIDKNINAREQEISAPSTDKIPHDPK